MDSPLSIQDAALLASTPRLASVQTAQLPLWFKLKMRLWLTVQSTFFRWSPGFCRGFRRWLLRLFGARLASTASVHNTARIDCPWNLEMGPFASIGEHAWIYSLDRISLEEYVCVGQRVILLTGTHDFTDPHFPLVTKPIRAEYGSWVATGATILPGVTIGKLCVVGASSVVTKSLPAQMVCAGNPCKPIKKRELKAS